MANYGHIIVFSLLGGVVSLLGGIILLSKRNWTNALAKYATPFAAGALLAAVFLDLLNEGIELAHPYTVLLSALIGMISFFFAERFLRWFHHHHREDSQTDPTSGLIIVGDTVHNALDGIAIAASFLVSIPTGIITTIAVAAHEIPQEIGDFGLLLKKGMTRKKVLLANALSAVATTALALTTFWLGSDAKLPIGVLLGLSAGFLLYIAASDVIPTIHEETKHGGLLDVRPFLVVIGAVVVGLSINIAHKYIEPDHQHHEEVQSDHSIENTMPVEKHHDDDHNHSPGEEH